tara:strand:+ start:76 stop:1656 length:1581 start_codon:yes stop_codon:yes gene_type:complete
MYKPKPKAKPKLPGIWPATIDEKIMERKVTRAQVRNLDRLLTYFYFDLDSVDGPSPAEFRTFMLEFLNYGEPSVTSYTQMNILRRTFREFYLESPFLRAFDAATTSFWHEVRPKKEISDYKPNPLRFSIPEDELPPRFCEALSNMKLGFDGIDKAAPATSILTTMQRKICELGKVCKDADINMDMSVETATLYERSLLARKRPLSPSTIRSSMVHIRDFALYLGYGPAVVDHLKARVKFHESRAGKSTPLKEIKIQKIPTYTEIFEDAFDMLGKADTTKNRRVAQKLRNYAVALVLMCPFPLRVADTILRFGENLTWTGETYRLYIPSTSKNGEPFQAILHPFFRVFVDKLVLQGADPEYLDELREKCLGEQRLLFETHSGSQPFANYVSYAWANVYGTGCHIARAKIHNELAVFGLKGVEQALKACTHRSSKSAEDYRTKTFQILAGDHVRKTAEDSIKEHEWNSYFESPLVMSAFKAEQIMNGFVDAVRCSLLVRPAIVALTRIPWKQEGADEIIEKIKGGGKV